MGDARNTNTLMRRYTDGTWEGQWEVATFRIIQWVEQTLDIKQSTKQKGTLWMLGVTMVSIFWKIIKYK